MSEARIDRITNENNTAGPIISGITTFSGQNFFVPPKGTTAQRPSNCPPGSIRFNTDSAKLEYFDNLQWLEMEAFNVEIGISTNAAGTSGGLGNRGVFGGGTFYPATYYNVIEYVTISTTGNAIDFGDLTVARSWYSAALSSSTRGIWAGNQTTSSPYAPDNRIDYVTISSTGNAQDFGDLITNVSSAVTSGASSSTRGLIAGGDTNGLGANTNVIQYITMDSTGNSVDFGDLAVTRYALSCLASSTRGVFGGFGPAYSNSIEFVTISTLGNAADFGDLLGGSGNGSGASNATRGLFTIGIRSPAATNIIEFITIASTGNATDFGDTTQARFYGSSVSSSTRGLHAGGANGGAGNDINIIDYVTILTTGNAIDFGDLSAAKRGGAACSNGHGGL